MKLRRRAAVLLSLACSCFAALGCRAHPHPDQDSPVLVLKASSSSAPNEPTVRGLEVFGEELAAATNGRIVVEIYPNNALGNEREVIELAILGAIEVACPANAPLATFSSELLVFDLPYLFRDREHMYEVLDGPIGQSFGAPLEAKGLRLLGYFDVGLRHLMTRDRKVEAHEDMAGLKIRTMESPLHLQAFERFGASPLPMAYGEVYTALEQGVIDGAEAARSNYLSKRFYEVAPHWAEIGWMYLVAPLIMSERVFDSLSAEDQAAVRGAAQKAVAAEREFYRLEEESALEALRAAGVAITRPDRTELERLAREVWESSSSSGRVDLDLVESIVTTHPPARRSEPD
jgi:tripartite ATP-independent transporter DctP family solute receptor